MGLNSGYGYGYGCYGYGDGCSGFGYGCSGDGYGYGDGCFGDGDGYGYGCYGYGDGCSGYGYGCSGLGYGYGDGCSGFGYGCSGYGDGCGDMEIILDYQSAWSAYHYIAKNGDSMILRNGKTATVGEKLHEDKIKMCQTGLHASLARKDAATYRPSISVLTRVKVWGKIRIQRDKLVATDRQIIAIINE